MAGQNPSSADVLLTEPLQKELREKFFRWQCRVRQSVVRESDGRPSPGMRPQVRLTSDSDPLATMNVLIIKSDPETIARFRYIARKSWSPKECYDSALGFLAESYFQEADEFSSELTALCGQQFVVADKLLGAEECVLEFEQSTQWFQIPCRVRNTAQLDPLFQATYWHNNLFNPNLPGNVRVLAFTPKWQKASSN